MFEIIKKTFKALNSSGKSWQLSGAVVLGMFAGFLPTNSLILLAVLFIALILNINFGLAILFTVIFSGIGYLFDPMFESLGYAILTDAGMKDIFTGMYNSATWRWLAFNYTLVTGALAVSFALALPMMLILNKLVSVYRVQIGQKLNEWKLTKWMKLYNEEAVKTSMFRIWGLGVFGGFATIIAVLFIFLFDPIVRFGMEKGLSYSLETEVNIKDFKSSFSDLSIEIDGIQIADKDKLTHNLVQLDKVAFDLGFSALVEKKAFIQNLEVKALAFDEKRANIATAYKVMKAQEKQAAKDASKDDDSSESSSMDIANPFKIPSVDDILKNEKLASVEEAKKLQADIKNTKAKWEKISSDLQNKGDVAEIKADVKKLKKVFKSKDFAKMASAKDDADKIKKKVKALKQKYKDLQREFKADQKRIQKQIAGLKDLPAKDIARLKKKYSLDANGGMNIVGALVDKEVDGYMRTAMKYYEMLKPYMKKSGEEEVEEPTPPRGQGRWVKFANLSNIPDLVIQNAKIGAALKNDTIEITMKDFSSDQKKYKKPMTLHVDASGTSYEKVVGDLVDNRMGDLAKTSFDVKMIQFKADKFDMQALSMNDVSVNATFKGSVNGSDIEALSDIDVTKAQLKMGSQEIVNELLSGISAFGVNISLDGDVSKPKIGVKTDLDKQLSKGMSKMISKKAKEFENDLTKGIMGKATGSAGGIDSGIGDLGSVLGDKETSLDGLDLDSLSGGGKSGGAGGLLNKFF